MDNKNKDSSVADITLKERDPKYGTFRVNSRVAHSIKSAFRAAPNWDRLPTDMAESLDMVAHKLSRLLCGDFNHLDSWHDAIGYLRLVERRLLGESP